MTQERRKTDIFNGLAALALTAVLAFVGYSADRELHHIDIRFDSLDKKFDSVQIRTDCITQKLAVCCQGDKTIC